MTASALQNNTIRFAQVAVAVGVMVLLWQVVEGEKALDLLIGANPGWLLAAFLVLSLQTVLSAIRWRLIASRLNINLSGRTALKEYYLAQLVNQVLPGGVLGDAGRALRSRSQAGLASSAQAVILERLAGQLALFALLVVAFCATLLLPGGLDWPNWLLLTVSGLALVALALTPVLIVISRATSGRLARLVREFAGAAKKALLSPAALRSQIFLSIGTALCNVAGFTFVAWGLGSELSVSSALALIPMILLAMLLPISVSGWGLREAAAVALFPVAGLAAVEGLAVSVAFGLICLAVALPGLAFIGSNRKKFLAGKTLDNS